GRRRGCWADVRARGATGRVVRVIGNRDSFLLIVYRGRRSSQPSSNLVSRKRTLEVAGAKSIQLSGVRRFIITNTLEFPQCASAGAKLAGEDQFPQRLDARASRSPER